MPHKYRRPRIGALSENSYANVLRGGFTKVQIHDIQVIVNDSVNSAITRQLEARGIPLLPEPGKGKERAKERVGKPAKEQKGELSSTAMTITEVQEMIDRITMEKAYEPNNPTEPETGSKVKTLSKEEAEKVASSLVGGEIKGLMAIEQNRSHTLPSIKPLVCTVCKKEFTSNKKFHKHVRLTRHRSKLPKSGKQTARADGSVLEELYGPATPVKANQLVGKGPTVTGPVPPFKAPKSGGKSRAWKCKICAETFETKNDMHVHIRQEGHHWRPSPAASSGTDKTFPDVSVSLLDL